MSSGRKNDRFHPKTTHANIDLVLLSVCAIDGVESRKGLQHVSSSYDTPGTSCACNIYPVPGISDHTSYLAPVIYIVRVLVVLTPSCLHHKGGVRKGSHVKYTRYLVPGIIPGMYNFSLNIRRGHSRMAFVFTLYCITYTLHYIGAFYVCFEVYSIYCCILLYILILYTWYIIRAR